MNTSPLVLCLPAPAPLPRFVGELTGLVPLQNCQRKAAYFWKREMSGIREYMDDQRNAEVKHENRL